MHMPLPTMRLLAVEESEVHFDLASNAFWEKMGASALLVLLGGVFAGLTIALMGLDELHLKVLAASSGDPVEQENAKKVLALLRRGRHWVLVVLLLSNVIINESLPIFLDSAIGGGFAAVALSTTAIVIFGEVIPQSLCVKYGLGIGAACAPLVLGMMYLLAPIAYPIARLLDWALGADEGCTYQKPQLISFLKLHHRTALCDDEISILNGALELGTKNVSHIMTPMRDVVTLAADAVLDDKLLEFILNSGYSRFPVHEKGKPDSFIGLLLVKKLLRVDTSQARTVSSLPLSILPEAHPGISCFQALDYFQTGRAHLLLISRTPGRPGGALGVVTLEDIIEEVLCEEIVDETDWYGDNVTKQRPRRTTTPAVMQGIVESPRSSIADLQYPNSHYFEGGVATPPSERTPLLGGSAVSNVARTLPMSSISRGLYSGLS